MLAELQRRVEALAETERTVAPKCPRCGQLCAAKMRGRCPGWLVLGDSRRGLRDTVARRAVSSAERCWIGSGDRDGLAVRWRLQLIYGFPPKNNESGNL